MPTDKKVEEFLLESNKIEGEYSKEALQDAKQAWNMVCIINKPISPELICRIHRGLMKRLNPLIAGRLRNVDVWVGNRKCLNPKFVKEELRLLCNPGIHPVLNEEFIKKWHIAFEKIHPFEDGNGRTGRILMNLQRIKIGLPLLIIHTGKEQQEYYKWFK